MPLDQILLEILRCPDEHHAELSYDEAAGELTCTECGRIFEIRDGVPVMLLDEARTSTAGATPDPSAPDAAEAR